MRHQYNMLVLIISFGLWTAVTCNGNQISHNSASLEDLQLALRDSELLRQKLELNFEKTVLKLVISQMQNGDIDSASEEFETLKNRDALVKDLVHLAYSKKVQLQNLASFVCKINGITTGYIAMNVLYHEMAKNKQSDHKEMVTMYFKTLGLVDCKYFASQPSELQNNILELKTQLELRIMTPLVDDIKKSNFTSPIKTVNTTKVQWDGDEFLLVQLMKFYVADQSLKSQRPQLLDFVRRLPSFKSMCHAYAAIWRELRASGGGESMEALAVWSHASEIILMAVNISDNRCFDIANSKAPAYMQTLDSNYNYYIKYGHSDKIRDLHTRYYLKNWFAYFLSSLNLSELQNGNFNKVVDAIYALPYISDVCYAVAAVYKKFEAEQMLGTFEHFQILQIVKKMKNQAGYVKIDAISKSNCESVEVDMPPMFHKLLYKDTTNCRLLNRYYVDEPIFCTNETKTEYGYRKIYTMTNKTIAFKDQYWNVTVAENTHGVTLRNRNHTSMSMRFIRDKVRGSDQKLDLQHDYFRIHTKQTNFLLLEPMFKKAYVAACTKICDNTDKKSNMRCIGMMLDPLDMKAHWKLVCSNK